MIEITSTAIAIGEDALTLDVYPGETVFIRRSSLIAIDGKFAMKTHKIAKRSLSVIGLFSGQTMWANAFTAEEGGLQIIAGRDFHGRVASIAVTPDMPVFIQPGLYLGHKGDLTFLIKRVAKKEFWTLTEVTGSGTVHIKLPGRPMLQQLRNDGMIVDTDYVSAICGSFEAFGKVFKTGEVVKSGELSNVRLSGQGEMILQSENPEGADGSGGIFGSLVDMLPF
jgi:uncharacterized protein (AIM24 family)